MVTVFKLNLQNVVPQMTSSDHWSLFMVHVEGCGSREQCVIRILRYYQCNMDLRLPVEIIENILLRENVSFKEVLNFALTNKYNYDVVIHNARIWMQKYFQTYVIV